jgi:Mrp family chromosome partitioning ATPase
MAKVYDALRRAEEERRKLSDPATQPHRGLEWEPEPIGPSPRRAQDQGAPRIAVPSTVAEKIAEETAGDLNKAPDRRLLQPDSYVAEQFPRAARPDRRARDPPTRRIRTIAMTSAVPGEGKTTARSTSALVTALSAGARAADRTAICAARACTAQLGLRPKAGLLEVLNGDVTFEEAVVRAEGADLDVLAVRDRPVNPRSCSLAEHARPDRRGRQTLTTRVLDTPAASCRHAKAVGDQCDGLVMVVRADKTRQETCRASSNPRRGRMLAWSERDLGGPEPLRHTRA